MVINRLIEDRSSLENFLSNLSFATIWFDEVWKEFKDEFASSTYIHL